MRTNGTKGARPRRRWDPPEVRRDPSPGATRSRGVRLCVGFGWHLHWNTAALLLFYRNTALRMCLVKPEAKETTGFRG